jgi:TolB-like protein/Tfp pilus assembly protein PilF
VTDGPQDGEGNTIWDRLRRRKVVQWGLAYAAGAWGLLQGLQFLTDAFEWPNSVLRLATVLFALGLPVALVLAWYHGDRGQQRVSRIELAIVTLLFLIGGSLFWYYQRSIPVADLGSTAQSPASPAASDVADTGPSVAVLPFDNRSAKDDDVFFVDGIHDDILTQLSKVSALKVISRTSVEQFRDTKLPIREIARQLGVKTVLEGGVQRGGERVRINVQLIDAGSDAHLWAETYDRDLTAENIFAIQSEVARAIAGALKTALTEEEKARVESVPTESLEAWEAYQLGRQRMARRTSESLAEAERFFRRTIELDPNFAFAHAALADTLRLQTEYSGRPLEATLAEADRMIAKALELDPGLAEAWAAKGGIAMSRADWPAAEHLLRRAIEFNPSYAQAHHWLSLVLRGTGRQQEDLEHAERAVQLDPLSAIANLNLGDTLHVMGHFDEAVARYRRAIDIDPMSSYAYYALAMLDAYARNRLADAVMFQERAVALDSGNPMLSTWLVSVYLDVVDVPRAEQLVESSIGRWPDNFYANVAAAVTRELRGASAAAAQAARRALAGYPRDSWSLGILRNGDLRRGDPGSARARYASALPELLKTSGPPQIDAMNLSGAIDLALVLQEAGESDRAAALLEGSEQVIRGIPRLGGLGYGIADAQIHALRGDKSKALAALRAAEAAGWRGPIWMYYRDVDPNLASIRGEPEFKAIFADIERDVARQRAELAARLKDAPLDLAPVH